MTTTSFSVRAVLALASGEVGHMFVHQIADALGVDRKTLLASVRPLGRRIWIDGTPGVDEDIAFGPGVDRAACFEAADALDRLAATCDGA